MKKSLIASTIRIKRIRRPQLERMYHLFTEYYQNHTLESFIHDLYEKDHVILLHDRKTKELQGFSTLLQVPLKKSGKRVLGVYSGDTVVNRDYWGSPALGVEFLKYLWKLKVKRVGTPVYWFLISKGYKTYLIMARNFFTYYPRFDQETPLEYKKLMVDFYGKKFGSAYDASKDLIIPKGAACALKDNIAEITTENLKEPRIAFFQQKNPAWREGHELTCVAKMTMLMPFKYALKKAWKRKARLQ